MIFSPSAINERKNRVTTRMKNILKDQDIILIFSGETLPKPGGHDQTYPFLPHPDYYWISGSRRSHGITTYSPKDGWRDFILPITRDEKIWEGGGEVIPGEDLKNFDSWLEKFSGHRLFLMGDAPKNRSFKDAVDGDELEDVIEAFHQVRRVKDEEEIELISRIAHMANQGYRKIQGLLRPGLTEREIQIEYEAEVFRAGAHKMPYESIVGAGTNGAILHAIPTLKRIKDGELVLIDAGADLHDYCVDITRVYPANGQMSSQQKSIYQIVKQAQKSCIDLCRPGTEWRDVHLNAARVMAQGLHDLNILRVNVDEAMETGAISTFFPHGVGHMVGLRVRDVGGPPNPRPKTYAGSRVRADLPLKEGFLMTVEPGLYFISALLEDEQTRQKFRDQINWQEVEKWKDFGGIRLEDDIHVTAQGPQNLTAMVEML